jgi:hypothetical protein
MLCFITITLPNVIGVSWDSFKFPSDIKSIVRLMFNTSQQDVMGVSHALVDSVPFRAVTHEPSAIASAPAPASEV